MAKRTKSAQTSSTQVSGGAVARQPEAVERFASQQAASAVHSSSRVAIADSDRAAAAIPDIVRAENDAHERIAARAYEIYLQRGASHGRDTDDWLEAEREVGDRTDRPNDE
jgi:hypothetical protein